MLQAGTAALWQWLHCANQQGSAGLYSPSPVAALRAGQGHAYQRLPSGHHGAALLVPWAVVLVS
jgi:hypothetical protein